MALSKPHHRHRSPSDPFTDPHSISYSSYGVPTLTRNAPQQSGAPPLPPKVPPKSSRPHTSHARPTMATEVITTTDRRSNDSPRVRMGRSQTTVPPPQSQSRPSQSTRRSQSQDSVVRAANNMEKAKSSSRRAAPPTKKGSSHADVIDRLDFSGVGPMFHHDGPFDACAPSRNRHRTKAPMLAWTGAAEEDRDAFANAREIPSSNSPYPAPGLYAPYEAPKKKHDAIAEAWGIHEPEPFEDFSAGGGYSARASGDYSSGASTPYNSSAPTRRNKDGAREKYREYLEEPQQSNLRRQPTKRALPPPQPIFVPEAEADNAVLPPSPTGAPASPGAPKRSKSLMHRIRKMRDSPNVPPAPDDGYAQERDTSPPSSTENAPSSAYAQPPTRPTHRSQNSFLGRLGRKVPSSPTEETYAYVRDNAPPMTRREKSLPATPGNNVTPGEDDGGNGYFEGGGGLGRKTSLLKKVKGVVKGTNTR